MEKNFILNRRTVLGGAAALGTVGVLAACGSSKDSKATTQGATAGTDAKELYAKTSGKKITDPVDLSPEEEKWLGYPGMKRRPWD